MGSGFKSFSQCRRRAGAGDTGWYSQWLDSDRTTFLVLANETTNILNNATDRSLIILDEIGRGTSTYDGLSIAWAVVEHLHRAPERGPRTVFVTHYQELTQLEKHLPRLRNFSVAVKERNHEIVFVRRVIPGAATAATASKPPASPGAPGVHQSSDDTKRVRIRSRIAGALVSGVSR